MRPKDIMIRNLEGEEAPRPGVSLLINWSHACRALKIPLHRYVIDPEVMARAQLAVRDLYDHDWLWFHQGFLGVSKRDEIDSSGGRIVLKTELGIWFDLSGDSPKIIRTILSSPDDLEEFEPPDPFDDARLRPIKLMCKLGRDYLICGTVRGPLSIAADWMLPMERFLILMKRDPDSAREILRESTKLALEFAEAQVDAGADAIFIPDPISSPNVISPKDFERFSLPYLSRLIRRIEGLGALTILHICGNIGRILPLLSEIKVRCLSVEHTIGIEEVMERARARCFWGNVNTLDLVEKDEDYIRGYCRSLLSKARPGFVLSSGCVVPANARRENLKAMIEEAKRYGFED